MLDLYGAADLDGIQHVSARGNLKQSMPIPDTTDEKDRPLWKLKTVWRHLEERAYGIKK